MKDTATAPITLSAIQVGQQVQLPDLIAYQKIGVGAIRQHLRSGSTELVKNVEPFPISKYRVENICTLALLMVRILERGTIGCAG